ncbi:MAG: hypothetical protein JEZ09_09845 [Salinivirgaceae bacterium]|nr:hypothetical protein [Salinivirgaceae bacterium]
MNDQNVDNTSLILETLKEKAVIKQQVYNQTLEVFKSTKKVIKYLISNYKRQLKDVPEKISLGYVDKGIFEAEMKIAGDMLIFNMHSNVFEFPSDHWIWKNDYVKNNESNSYCGIINIYNFLADSFKYNRQNDYGFIIARIFVNREGHYFIEGNPNFGSIVEDFGVTKLDISKIREIIQYLIVHTLEVDLLVPAMKDIQVATVGQMMDKINNSKMKTGKPLGFQSNSETQIKL